MILKAINEENDNYFLIIKARNIGSQNQQVKKFEK